MAGSGRWSGWVSFAGLLMIVIGGISFFEGLIAVIRKQYYVLTPDQIIVFNVKTWGWIVLILGVVLVLTGLALLARAAWARWFAIVVATLSVFAQLGFVGSSAYPLWALFELALTVLILFALIARWDEAKAT